jgi:hypothetical protein
MRAQTELALCGAAAVFLAFFSWPVPKVVKDLYQTGVGRLVVLGAIVYLAKFQSVPLAILLAIYYVKACRAAYSEGFEAEEKKEDKKEEKKEVDPSRTSSSSGLPASKGSSAGAKAVESGKTEHYQNFMPF